MGTMIRFCFVMMVFCGIIYPLGITGLAQAIMPAQSNGSILYNKEGEAVGSLLIGQNVTNPGLFQGRISSISYDASASGSPNYAPSNEELVKRVNQSVEILEKEGVTAVPGDLITNSASGLDPHISPESAYIQVARVSKATGLSEKELEGLISKHTEQGLLKEEKVNVLLLNLEVNQRR